jgi:hypothetical protein
LHHIATSGSLSHANGTIHAYQLVLAAPPFLKIARRRLLKLNGIDAGSQLRNVLSGHRGYPINRIEELRPRNPAADPTEDSRVILTLFLMALRNQAVFAPDAALSPPRRPLSLSLMTAALDPSRLA